jgi:RNA polymerase sigma-70 factor (ECF subfamily)
VVAAASRGERCALAELFRTYHPRLIRFLRAQEPRVADDLAGEVWMAIAGRLDSFQGDEPDFRCWLFAIARNRLADHRRRAARRRTDPLPPTDIEPYVDRLGSPDPAEVVTDLLGAQQAIDFLVSHLPPAQADVVLLRVVGGIDVRDVARMTGRSEGAVRVLQHRALKRLASMLTPQEVTT